MGYGDTAGSKQGEFPFLMIIISVNYSRLAFLWDFGRFWCCLPLLLAFYSDSNVFHATPIDQVATCCDPVAPPCPPTFQKAVREAYVLSQLTW